MATLCDAGSTLKLRKCELFTNSDKYLANIIRHGQLLIEEAGVKSLKEAKHPKTQTEL